MACCSDSCPQYFPTVGLSSRVIFASASGTLQCGLGCSNLQGMRDIARSAIRTVGGGEYTSAEKDMENMGWEPPERSDPSRQMGPFSSGLTSE